MIAILFLALGQAPLPQLDLLSEPAVRKALSLDADETAVVGVALTVVRDWDEARRRLLFETPPERFAAALKALPLDPAFADGGRKALTEVVPGKAARALALPVPPPAPVPPLSATREAPFFLRSRLVQELLELSAAQRQQVAETVESLAAWDLAHETWFGRRASAAGLAARRQAGRTGKARRQAWAARLLAPLSPAQRDRLVGVRLGASGVSCVFNPEFGDAFGVTDDQRKAFAARLRQGRRDVGGPAVAMQATMTEAQRERWRTLRVDLGDAAPAVNAEVMAPPAPPAWAVRAVGGRP